MIKIKVTTIEGLANSIEGLKTHIEKRFDEVIQSVAKGFENEHEYFEQEFKEVKLIAEKVSRYDKKIDLLFDSFSLDHKRT